MDYTKFKETEQKYKALKERVARGELSPDDMKRDLKKMMVLDGGGNYWMIGGKTGRWYIYNGADWKEDNPYKAEDAEGVMVLDEPMVQAAPREARPSPQGNGFRPGPTLLEKPGTGAAAPLRAEPTLRETRPLAEPPAAKEKPVFNFGRNNEAATELRPARGEERFGDGGDGSLENAGEEGQDDGDNVCKNCKAQIPVYSHYCHICGANQRVMESPMAMMAAKGHLVRNELVVTAIKMPSLIFFLGGLGLIIGVLLGAAFGIFKPMWPDAPFDIPLILNDTRGGVAGGLVFAIIGGLGGFLLAALAAAAVSAIYNLLAFIFGGIRFQIKQ